MRIGHRLALGFGLLVAMLIAVIAYHRPAIADLRAMQVETIENSMPTALALADMIRSIEQQQSLVQKVFVLGFDPVRYAAAYVAKLDKVGQRFEESIEQLRVGVLNPAEQALLERIEVLWAEGSTPQATLDAASDAELGSSAVEVRLFGEGPPIGEAMLTPAELAELGRLDRLHAAILDFRRALVASTLARVDQARIAGLHLERTNRVMLVAALVSSLIVGVLTSRSVGRSISRLIEATRAIGDGRFTHQLDAGGDELGRVADAWNLMTRRLEALDHMKKDFVARVSHDLRTPLVAMQETTDLLLAGLAGPLDERQARLLRLHRESGRRLAGRIANLLALSRIEAGAFELDIKAHDVGELFRFVLREMLVPARRRGLSLSVDLPTTSIPLRCDNERMTQVLENLLDNAIKHAPRGGHLEVATRAVPAPPVPPGDANDRRPWPSPGHMAFIVADSGPGIPVSDRDRIFESFYRGGESSTARGSGLGLAICRDLVEAHGGRIWVDERPGGGARFNVVLPWQPEGLEDPAAAGQTTQSRAAANSHPEEALAGRRRTLEAKI